MSNAAGLTDSIHRFDRPLATFGENYLICRRAPRSPHHAPLRDPLAGSLSIN
jgi:hypothetical protein